MVLLDTSKGVPPWLLKRILYSVNLVKSYISQLVQDALFADPRWTCQVVYLVVRDTELRHLSMARTLHREDIAPLVKEGVWITHNFLNFLTLLSG